MSRFTHDINSVRYDRKKNKVVIYTTCGRIIVEAQEKGIEVLMRTHKNKIVMDEYRWGKSDTASTHTDVLSLEPRRKSQMPLQNLKNKED